MSPLPSPPRTAPRWAVLLVASLALAAVVDVVIYLQVAPIYEASAVLGVRPHRPSLFPDPDATFADRRAGWQAEIDTQLALLASSTVLKGAAMDPSLQEYTSSKTSLSEVFGDRLKFAQKPNTVWIVVSFESEDAANVANAVASTCLDFSGSMLRGDDDSLPRDLAAYLEQIHKDQDRLIARLSGNKGELDGVLVRLLGERLFPIRVEQAEAGDDAKRSDLEKKAERLHQSDWREYPNPSMCSGFVLRSVGVSL